jgi:hypothetical protein
MTLPIPKDINFEVPETTEKKFFDANPEGFEEDKELLATGAWDDVESDTVE